MSRAKFFFQTPIRRFATRKPSASTLLFLTTIAVAIIANTPLSEFYFEILQKPITLQIGGFNLFSHHGEPMSLMSFANDVLMVLFFLNVGLEIKQETLVGELSSLKRAMFPVVGAVGGMIFPVLLYFAVCHTAPAVKGMAIPMATDIAFALAVLSSIKGLNPMLKTFLATLAVADDIGGILVIAIFYTAHIDFLMLGLGVLCLGVIYVLGRLRVQHLWVYYFGLLTTWFFFLHSGVHTTIAGVLVAFLLPAKPKAHTREMVDLLRSRLNLFPEGNLRTSKSGAILLPHEQIGVMHSISRLMRNAVSPVQRMEQQLTSLVNYLVLPLFAFVNAGVQLGGMDMQQFFGVPLAIILGLFVGKTVGIALFARLYLWITKSTYPKGMNAITLLGVSVLGGIGFTVSLFIAALSFPADTLSHLLNEAKVGIYAGSILSGLIGYLILQTYYIRKGKQGPAKESIQSC